MIDLFIEVQWNRVMDLDSEAREVLAKFQATILGHRKRQVNLVVDYYKEAGFEEESELEEVWNKEDEDTSDEEEPVSELVEDNEEESNKSEYQILLWFYPISIIT